MRVDGICNAFYSPTSNVPMNLWIKQSQEYTDELIEVFESAIEQGYNPTVVYDNVFEQVGCNESDLTSVDKTRLIKKVNEMWKSKENRKR